MTRILTIIALLFATLGFAKFAQGKEIRALERERIASAELAKCEQTYGRDTNRWTQCVNVRPVKYHGSSYTGSWSEGKPHGRGILLTPKTRYEGEIWRGLKSGFGRYEHSSGIVYTGTVAGSGYKGHGMFELPDGGFFEVNKHTGSYNSRTIGPIDGIRTTADGITVEGKFRPRNYFTTWEAAHGDATVTFKNGQTWTGLHEKLWNVGASTKGKLRTKDGQIIDAVIRAIAVGLCPDMGACDSFELTALDSGRTNCATFKAKEQIYSPKGLPYQLGPIFLGMSFENFQCVTSNSFEDDEQLRGMPRTPKSMLYKIWDGKFRVAKAQRFDTPSTSVSSLFNNSRNSIEASFWNDKLVSIKIWQPAVPTPYLIDKYGEPALTFSKKFYNCISTKKERVRRTSNLTTYTWEDQTVKVTYGSKMIPYSHSWYEEGYDAHSCENYLISVNTYELVDLKLHASYRAAVKKNNAANEIKQRDRNRELYNAF